MSASMSIDYPIFKSNNESVILKPGSQFTSRELKSRLHQMDIDARDIQSRPKLINLYESTLRDDRNKFKLFDRLKKDTEIYEAKMGLSLNQTMPMPSSNENIKHEKSKVINLVYNETPQPYEENSYQENNIRRQEIRLKRPQNKANNNITNPFFTSGNYEQNNDNTYNEEEEEEEINNKNQNKYNNYNYNQNSRNFQNNESGYNDFNNTNNYNNYYRNNNYNENYRKPNIEYNNDNRKIYTNNPDNYTPNVDLPTLNNKIRNTKNIDNTENIKVKDPDEESSYTFFSTFSSLKTNSKQICFHVLMGFIIILLAFGFLLLYRTFSESINEFFSNVFDVLSHPGQIVSNVLDYWYIIPIILIFLIIVISFWRKYQLKKRCEEIIKKIEEDLSKENEDNRISEDDIYTRYAQGYGITIERFRKKYLPLLRKMRRKNRRLKNSSEKIDGKDVIFWHIIDE